MRLVEGTDALIIVKDLPLPCGIFARYEFSLEAIHYWILSMQEYPHRYTVAATVQSEGQVLLDGIGLTPIESTPPPEFGGPEGFWSPETLLVSAVADCFVLSFKAIARASSMSWISLHCEVEGVLDRVERISQFTDFNLRVTLEVPAGTDVVKATRLLEKAEEACLITNSLKSATHLDATVNISE